MLSHINVETESETFCFRRDGIVISIVNPVRTTVTVSITFETRVANLDINSKIFIVFNVFIHHQFLLRYYRFIFVQNNLERLFILIIYISKSQIIEIVIYIIIHEHTYV